MQVGQSQALNEQGPPPRYFQDDELPSEAVPNDTFVALQLLVNQFPAAAKVLRGG